MKRLNYKTKFAIIFFTIFIFVSACVICNYNMVEQYNQIPIYVLSLETSIQRRNRINKEFKKYNIKFKYFNGIDGNTLDTQILKQEGIVDKDSTLTRGEIGCYMSHIELLKIALINDTYILVLEDDVKIESNTMSKINNLLEKVPSDFELLFIGYNYHEDYDTFKKVNYLHGTQSYIINPKNITIEKINTLYPISKPIDTIIATKFKTYITIPKLIELNEFGGMSNTQAII